MDNTEYLKKIYTNCRKDDIFDFLSKLKENGLDGGLVEESDRHSKLRRHEVVEKYASLFTGNKEMFRKFSIYAKRGGSVYKKTKPQTKPTESPPSSSYESEEENEEAKQARIELDNYEQEFKKKQSSVSSYKTKLDNLNSLLEKRRAELESIKGVINATNLLYEREKTTKAEERETFLKTRNMLECKYIELKYNKKPKVEEE
jgi:hypothetical protein